MCMSRLAPYGGLFLLFKLFRGKIVFLSSVSVENMYSCFVYLRTYDTIFLRRN